MKLIKVFWLLMAMYGLSTLAFAGGAAFWEVAKQVDIEKGEAEGISITDDGIIKSAPNFTEVFNTDQPVVYSSISDKSGQIYLGTGHDGKVFKVDKSGKGSLFFDSPELDVTALAIDNNGVLYAGTSPDGKVYRITADGKATPFFDPEDRYIWSMAFDRSNNLYVGSGDKGLLYKVDSTGKGSVFVKTNEKHVISMVFDTRGNLLAGTDPDGLVLRISPEGKVFALFDSPMKEIHNILLVDNYVYALGISGQPVTEKAVTTPPTTTNTTALDGGGSVTVTATFDDDTVVSSSSTTTSSTTSSSSSTSSKAVLYRILPEGGSDAIWTAREGLALSLILGKHGDLLVGTTQKGRIYSIEPSKKDVTLLIQSPEEQTTGLFEAGGNYYAASGNTGKLFRIGNENVKGGSYTSPVHDTKFSASWGRIFWRSTGQVQIQTRTGNTETPDATWSDWSTAYQSADGQQISSPSARFIQWKAKLQDNSTLTSVKLAYLPRNIAPEVSQLTVLASGIALQELPQQPVDPAIVSAGLDPTIFGIPTNLQPRKVFQKGARSLQWTAEDRNGDTMMYSVFYRTTSESDWHLLSADMKNSYLTLDADSLPDGKYTFKVIATDGPSNSADRELKGENISDTVEIDNTPPKVTANDPKPNGRQVEVKFSAVDNLSTIKRAEYSVDGAAWQVIFPDDGIADMRTESYTVKAELNGKGEHIIAFRCYDESANGGGLKVTVK